MRFLVGFNFPAQCATIDTPVSTCQIGRAAVDGPFSVRPGTTRPADRIAKENQSEGAPIGMAS